MSRLATVHSLHEHREHRNQPKPLLTYQELSQALHRSVRQLQRDRGEGMPVALSFQRFPGHGRVLFDLDEVVEWFRRRAR